jgi:hypothetical protein
MRYVAAMLSSDAPLFCGHVHIHRHLAERCAHDLRSRFPGARIEVASSFSAGSDPCPMADHHNQDRSCPVCGRKP